MSDIRAMIRSARDRGIAVALIYLFDVRTKIIDVCSWNKGTFGWYAGRENPREAFPLDFNAFEILGDRPDARPPVILEHSRMIADIAHRIRQWRR